MTTNSRALQNWTAVTGNLPWAFQRTVQDTLNLVQSGDIKVVYGTNEQDGYPCLINAIGSMIKDVNDSPSSYDGELVAAFDQAVRSIQDDRHGFVTDLTAEILIRNFGELKPLPAPELEELPEGPIVWTDVPDYVDFSEQG